MAEEGIVTESRSSFSVKENAKGEPQVEAKVYEGSDTEANQAASEQAVSLFKAMRAGVNG